MHGIISGYIALLYAYLKKHDLIKRMSTRFDNAPLAHTKRTNF